MMTTVIDAVPHTDSMDVQGRSWSGRRVTVVGLGRSGLAAARQLCRLGCRVRVTEAGESPSLRQCKEQLAALGATVELGGHTRGAIENAELVVVSPGVPESALPLQWALQEGVPIISEIELAFLFCPAPVIAVTGTNGKSTTVTLLAQLLQAAGHPAIACGNVGVPFCSILERLTPASFAVVEVSSFQLLWCDQFRPKIGVLLNIGVNHLDRHQDARAYLAAKARLFRRQTPEDWAVLNGADARLVTLGDSLTARCAWFGENRGNPPELLLAPQTRSALTEDAQAALQVGRLAGVADVLAWQVIRSFRGLEHRLEAVATVDGVTFVNDSKSTTPDSCRFAMARSRGDLVVILGGRDKGLDFTPLVALLHEPRVKGIVLIGETRERLRRFLNGSTTVRESATLEDAVHAARELSHPGTTVLFSPACASFDMFRDFEERGQAFKALVRQLNGAAC